MSGKGREEGQEGSGKRGGAGGVREEGRGRRGQGRGERHEGSGKRGGGGGEKHGKRKRKGGGRQGNKGVRIEGTNSFHMPNTAVLLSTSWKLLLLGCMQGC